jgi:predicted ArsR family transcriptional regulator
VLRRHPDGLTADEVAHALGESVLSVRPRICELGRTGKVQDTGRRRQNRSGRNAAVWELTR